VWYVRRTIRAVEVVIPDPAVSTGSGRRRYISGVVWWGDSVGLRRSIGLGTAVVFRGLWNFGVFNVRLPNSMDYIEAMYL